MLGGEAWCPRKPLARTRGTKPTGSRIYVERATHGVRERHRGMRHVPTALPGGFLSIFPEKKLCERRLAGSRQRLPERTGERLVPASVRLHPV